MADPQKSDPWEQAAAEYHAGANPHVPEAGAPSGGGADWQVWNGDAEAPQGMIGKALANFKNNTTERPEDGPIETISKRAASGIGQFAAHPIDSVTGGLRQAFGTMAPNGDVARPPSILAPYQGQGTAKGIEHALGDAAAGVVMGGATEGAMAPIPKIGQALKSGGAKLDNAMIGTPGKAARFGADPGAALSTNRIWGSPKSLMAGVDEKIPQVADENRGIIAANQGSTLLDRAGAIKKPFSSAIGEGADPVTGAASTPQIKAALRSQNQLLNEIDPATGQPVTHPMTGDIIPRPASISPLDAAKLKSNLYKRIDYDNPFGSSISNDALKGSAHSLKDQIESAIPESIESGQRLHNLMAAKDIIKPMAEGSKAALPTKSGLIDRAMMTGGTGVAAGLDALGSAAPKISRFLRPAPMVVGAFRKGQ